MIKTFTSYFLIAAIFGLSCLNVLACNCGCAGGNCGAVNNEDKIKEQKLFCEAPKDLLLRINESLANAETSKTNHGCNGGCKIEGEER